MKKLKEMRKNQKGFTLVELIVVLVILAILAAMMVPALLGYIDRAKEGKYEEEVHSIYTALQVVFDEAYAKGETALDFTTGSRYLTEINNMISPAAVTKIEAITTTTNDATPADNTLTIEADSNKVSAGLNKTVKQNYAVRGFKVTFTSQDATAGLTGELKDGVVTVTLPSGT